jgi:hypothetical protein
MHKIVLYCKTYRKDLESVKTLTESIKKYNKDSIPFYISIPKEDETIFKDNIDTDYVNIVFDEDIYDLSFLADEDKQKGGWHIQQIIKSCFWKLRLCENYVMIDSDSYFIKDFYISDFMYDENTPYTVMHEQKDLFEFTSKFRYTLGYDPHIGFKETREPIMKAFQRKGRYFDFGPSPVIWSCRVWELFEETQLKPQGLTFFDLIVRTPSEFTWYGEFLLKTLPMVIIPIEPMFRVIHFQSQYDFYKKLGYTEENFAENYLGIVMQSNFGAPLKF